MTWVPYFKVAFDGRDDKEEVGKNFQPTDSRASLGSVNDFSKNNNAPGSDLKAEKSRFKYPDFPAWESFCESIVEGQIWARILLDTVSSKPIY